MRRIQRGRRKCAFVTKMRGKPRPSGRVGSQLGDSGHALADWSEADLVAHSAWVDETLRAYGVERDPDGGLYTTADETTFGARFHALLSVVLLFSNCPHY